VSFQEPFVDPIVVAQPASQHDSEPVVVRIRNVDAMGFDLRLQEWDHQDGLHGVETVSYLVMERGTYTLPDGTQIEAERLQTNKTSGYAAFSFRQPFAVVPVLLTAVTSVNGGQAVTTRVRGLSPAGFRVRLQEQEANAQVHVTETIAYIAWEPSAGILDGMAFEVSTPPEMVTDQGYTIEFSEPFLSPPMVLAAMQTTNGSDTATLRWTNRDRFGIDIRIAEEQSQDDETAHTPEVVGYVLMW
jgi:hypothetical protein